MTEWADGLVTLKAEKYIICAEDLHWFEFSVILTTDSNLFSVMEKSRDLSVFFKIMCVRGK